jgi:hypothetical protein
MLAVNASWMPTETLQLHPAATAQTTRSPLDLVPAKPSPLRTAVTWLESLHNLILVGSCKLLHYLRENLRGKLIDTIYDLIKTKLPNFPIESQLNLYFHEHVRSFLIIPIGCRRQQQPKERTLIFQAGLNF